MCVTSRKRSLFYTRRTGSACIFLQIIVSLLKEEQDRCASFYRILSVCYKKNKISVHLSTRSSFFDTRRTGSACIFLHVIVSLLKEEQDRCASFYRILSVCYMKNKISVHLCASFYNIIDPGCGPNKNHNL